MILDPGDDPNGGGTDAQTGGKGSVGTFDPIDWAVATTSTDEPVLRIRETSERFLIVDALHEGTIIATSAPLPMPWSRFEIGLTWWFETDSSSHPTFESTPPLDLRPGCLVPSAYTHDAVGGRGLFDRESRSVSPALGPRLRLAALEYAGSGGELVDTIELPTGPARRLTVSRGTSAVQLIDELDDRPTSYRARFEIDPAGLALPDYYQVTVFEARDRRADAPAAISPFAVQPRWHPLYGFETRGRALHNTFAKTTPWTRVGKGPDRSTLELTWRASSSGPARDGVFTLTVDGGAEAALSGLHNGSMAIDQTRLGLDSLPLLAAGELIVDSFDSWR